MKKETFKDIPGYEGLYKISNLGRVKRLEKVNYVLRLGKIVKRTYPEIIMKQCIEGAGYYMLSLINLKKLSKSYRIHQLMAMTFLNHKPKKGLNVDHIDNNKLNNDLDNLQVITHRENNTKDRRGGTSKYTGVSWCKQSKKWKATISINKISTHLGFFLDELEAAEAYQLKLKSL
jgi:hypothetical protein